MFARNISPLLRYVMHLSYSCEHFHPVSNSFSHLTVFLIYSCIPAIQLTFFLTLLAINVDQGMVTYCPSNHGISIKYHAIQSFSSHIFGSSFLVPLSSGSVSSFHLSSLLQPPLYFLAYPSADLRCSPSQLVVPASCLSGVEPCILLDFGASICLH